MSEAELVTVACPHCAKQLRVPTAFGGQWVRCPHSECRRPVPVPFVLDDSDEPDEAVLLHEDPAKPLTVPIGIAPIVSRAEPVPTSSPKPNRKPRRREPEEDEPRRWAAILPWALVGALLALAVAVASWAVVGWGKSRTEDADRDLRAENKKLREQLDATKAAPKGPPAFAREINHADLLNLIDAGQLKSVTVSADRAYGEVRDPNHELARDQQLGPRGAFVVNLPRTPDLRPFIHHIESADARYRADLAREGRTAPEPVRITRDDSGREFGPGPPDELRLPKHDPPPRPSKVRAAFVGRWDVIDENLRKRGTELTYRFLDDGTCTAEVRNDGELRREVSGTWKWDGKQLHIETHVSEGKPAEVRWQGADEFAIVAEGGELVTFRRKR